MPAIDISALSGLWPMAAILALAVAASLVLARGTRPDVRRFLHLAAALYAALVLAVLFSVAPWPVSAITAPVAAAAMMLAAVTSFRRPASPVATGSILLGSAAAGIGVALGAASWVGGLPQLLVCTFMLGVARRGLLQGRAPSILLFAGALALAAATCAQCGVGYDAVRQALAAQILFLAAGQLGVTLAVARISDTFVPPPGRPSGLE